MRLKEFVILIERVCGEEPSYIAVLRWDKRKEAARRIAERCEEKLLSTSLMDKLRCRGREVSVYKTGKVLIRGVNSREEAEALLKELLGCQ